MIILRFLLAVLCGGTLASAAALPAADAITATRIGDAPIVTEAMLADADGESINGPTLLRVPAWVQHPLGRYYLYFSHHAGKYLRLAYADQLEGPWKILPDGVQRLDAQTALAGHLASPEAIVDEANHKIFLFYHGNNLRKADLKKDPADPDAEAGQLTAVSVSTDGVHFEPLNRIVGPAYLRVFPYQGQWFALNHSGILRRAAKLGEPFEPVATIIGPDIAAAVDPALRGEPGATPVENRPKNGPFRYSVRHVGTDVVGDRLVVYFSCAGHRPERVIATVVDLHGPPATWRARGIVEVLRPERDWEGAGLPLAYSRGGISRTRVRELRDPAVYREGDRAWLLYSTAGEHGLGLARIGYAFGP